MRSADVEDDRADPRRGEIRDELPVGPEARHHRLEPGPVHGEDVQDRLPLLAAEQEPVLEDEHLRPARAHVASRARAARSRAVRTTATAQANRKYRNQESEYPFAISVTR